MLKNKEPLKIQHIYINYEWVRFQTKFSNSAFSVYNTRYNSDMLYDKSIIFSRQSKVGTNVLISLSHLDGCYFCKGTMSLSKFECSNSSWRQSRHQGLLCLLCHLACLICPRQLAQPMLPACQDLKGQTKI